MTTKEKVVDYIWQDRELRFDSKPALLACRRGEKIIDSINSVEDTKGNNGERGSMIVTNLRILWIAHANSKINLSIGLNSIISVNIRKAKSKLRGRTQALCVLCKFTSRFEFIFTSLVKNSPRLFTTVQAVMRSVFKTILSSIFISSGLYCIRILILIFAPTTLLISRFLIN